MPKYKVTANQTLYSSHVIEVEASDAVKAEEVALLTDLDKWDDERLENGDGLSIDDVEEVKI